MRKLLSRLFSKLMLFVFLILLQIGLMAFWIYRASVVNYYANLALHIISIGLALYVVNQDIRPYNKLSWVFLILWLPFLGCLCYVMFGHSGLTRKKRKWIKDLNAKMQVHLPKNEDVLSELKQVDTNAGKQADYIRNYAPYPLYREKDTEYFASGEAFFEKLLEDLESAEDYIFLEYFIIQPGVMFDSVVEILERKAKAGVHVRLIYDGVGSIQTLPPRYYKLLQQKGIHCACFNPFRPFLSIIMNNRDHRKITVIDGKIAYTGGTNLADEYINRVERFGHWKDAAIRFTGEAVCSFIIMFLEMWNYIVEGDEDCRKFIPLSMQGESRIPEAGQMPETSQNPELTGKLVLSQNGYIQPYCDSPHDHECVGENVYLNLIYTAKSYCYIFTPYLIIGSEMATALINAAKSGVDVRIVVPDIPDKKMIFLLTQSYFLQLLEGGVRIYRYKPGFIHSKCFVADDEYAVVGTVNLDNRSLYLHFECGVWMYRTNAVLQVKEDVLSTLQESSEVTLQSCKERKFIIQLLQSILRLCAPLL